MQIRLFHKFCLDITACLALNAFLATAGAGFYCEIYRVNVILKNGASIYGFFHIISFDPPYETGTRIQDFIKSNQMTTLTIYRKLQTVRYPKGQIFAAAREDVVKVRTSDIKTIEYLSRMECQSENEPSEILSLPQRAINLLQQVPFAVVETKTGDNSSEVCLSYNRQISKPELRRVCGKGKKMEFNSKLTAQEIDVRLKQRFDGLFNMGIIVIQLTGTK